MISVLLYEFGFISYHHDNLRKVKQRLKTMSRKVYIQIECPACITNKGKKRRWMDIYFRQLLNYLLVWLARSKILNWIGLTCHVWNYKINIKSSHSQVGSENLLWAMCEVPWMGDPLHILISTKSTQDLIRPDYLRNTGWRAPRGECWQP